MTEARNNHTPSFVPFDGGTLSVGSSQLVDDASWRTRYLPRMTISRSMDRTLVVDGGGDFGTYVNGAGFEELPCALAIE